MYYIVYGLLWLVSLLPFSVLYFFSDGIYLLVFYVFKYRRNVVMSNLQTAFPEKNEKERIKIAKGFYQNLIDTFFESIKLITISKRQIEKRSAGEFDVINNLAAKGLNIHILAGHQFNWEYANGLFAMNLKIPFVCIYMPLTNKNLDKLFIKIRKRFGTKLISAQDFKSKMHRIFSQQHSLGLVADQNPGNPSNAYWVNFFGKPAPFLRGPAKGAVKNNTAVAMVGLRKIKRGHYHFDCTLLTETASLFSPQQLTVMYKNEVEKTIRKDPANYLWSHRRWKYEWKPEYGEIVE
jgi:KDO2-lipid IV(A) lauroyltransferase